jgi:8-oxo-dGTP pyrophosphatase MutT (NUDIX family)
VTRVEAAVLAPVWRDERGALRVLLVRRAPVGLHGGQLAFPGGKRDPEDETPLATALREAREEVGLEPERVHVLAELEPVDTRTTHYRVHPFLARIEPPEGDERWRRAPAEVEEVLEVEVTELLRPDLAATFELTREDWPAPRRFPCVRVGDHRLWGLTHHILMPLAPRLLAGEWDV